MKANKYIRILCEGEKTEPKYFRGIIKANRIRGARVVKPKDNSPLGIVKAAKEEIKIAKKSKIPDSEIEVWAVFDRDQHAKLPDAFQMARDNGIKVAFSNVCFEFWVLLHYEKSTKPFANCDEIIKYIRVNYDTDYLKKNDHYEKLYDKIDIAINNNEWLLNKHWKFELEKGTPIYDINSYTDVYHLVAFLKNLN